jgi:tetratricopeptide (TPR) repeat protein
MILVIVLLGVVAVYIHFISPRLNPEQRIRNFMDQNMFSEAEAELEKILESDPNNFKAHYQLGDLYFSQDMIDKGVLQFEEVLRINKFTHEVVRYDIMSRLGRVYLCR